MRLSESSFPGYLVAGQPAMRTSSDRNVAVLRPPIKDRHPPVEVTDPNRKDIRMLIMKKKSVKSYSPPGSNRSRQPGRAG